MGNSQLKFIYSFNGVNNNIFVRAVKFQPVKDQKIQEQQTWIIIIINDKFT